MILKREEAEQQILVRAGPGSDGPNRGLRAEDRVDHGGVLGEPATVLLRSRPLAVLAAIGQIQLQQRTQ